MLIFFDVDGVLNKRSQWHHPFRLDAECIHNFCTMAKSADGKLILASSWRIGFLRSGSPLNSEPVKRLEAFLGREGLIIAGKTVEIGDRNKEIEKYLEQYRERYIIVDDDPNEYSIVLPNTIFTDAMKGFTKKDARRCRRCML